MIATSPPLPSYCPKCGTGMMLDALTGDKFCPWCGGAGNRRALQPVTTARLAAERPRNRHERRAEAAKQRRA